jgi:hypothetical protein
MRRPQRLIAATVLIALCSALAGCGSMGNFDPSDLLDFLDTKKKLPGERKPVFPDGVPGLEQGVPKELYKGSREQQIQDPNAQAAAVAPTAPPPQEPKSKGSKSRGKQAPAAASAAPAAEPTAAAEPDAATAEEGGTAAAPPAPPPKRIVRKRTTAPPPDKPAAQSAAPTQSTQQSGSAFPAPLPSGTFTR